jgi:NADH-quinone oxidoreductase subunit E
MISEATRARFDREVAKYPADQKQSAVMACLAIVQQEAGLTSAPKREASWPTTWACRRWPCMRSRPSTTCTTSSRWASSSSTCAPTCRASCATGQKALNHLCKSSVSRWASTTADGLFTVQQSECLGACADSPVMLVNDRTMCSFMSNDKLDQLIDGLRAAEGQHERDQSFLSSGHRRADLFSWPPHQARRSTPDLNGSNWRLKDYEARGGYRRCARFARGSEGHDAGPGDCHRQGIQPCAGAAARAFPRA